jgi:hypothetical protein
MIKVDILCPQQWGDGCGDSYESRIYTQTEVNDITDACKWCCKDAFDYLKSKDPEYHGCRFLIYFNGQLVGEINTITHNVEFDPIELIFCNC